MPLCSTADVYFYGDYKHYIGAHRHIGTSAASNGVSLLPAAAAAVGVRGA